MEQWKGCTALVTGASAGIGAAIVKRLTGEGIQVVGCSRDEKKLQKLKDELKNKNKFYPISCDVSDRGSVEKMFAEITSKFGGVDICINNAGVGTDETLLDGDPDAWTKDWGVNVFGLCLCTKMAVNSMRERNIDGYVIHLNSVYGKKVIPKFHYYSATKFAVTALTQGLRQELRALNSKIRVSEISTGLVETEFVDKAAGKDGGTDVLQGLLGALNVSKIQTVEDTADHVMYLLTRPPHVQIYDIMVDATETA